MGGGHCEGRKVINETGCRIPRCRRRLIEKKEYKTWNLGFMREILNMFQICVYIKFIYTKTSIKWGGVCLFVSFFQGGHWHCPPDASLFDKIGAEGEGSAILHLISE